MISRTETFNQKGYVHLPNFLHQEDCNSYVEQFRNLIDQGQTTKDKQCPLSHSLGHTPLFDSLLEQLTPHIESVVGKKLHPTYAYARWYAPGDELKIHQDRPSCEISATITLGFFGNQWPIYMGYDLQKQNCQKVDMQVGDAVVYKGCEIYHWRERYTEGEWQAQVFIHYVNAEGPNREWKYDKRKKLAHHQETLNAHFKILKQGLSKKSLNNLINEFESSMDLSTDALLVGNVKNTNIRDCKKIQLDITRGVAATLTGIGLNCNKQFWNFDITHSNQAEFLRYDRSGHFSAHLDTIMEEFNFNETRKLTVITVLNNDFEGGQLYFQYGKEKIYPELEPGDVIIFPSFILHGVEPITSGIRRSLVTWLVGPYFK